MKRIILLTVLFIFIISEFPLLAQDEKIEALIKTGNDYSNLFQYDNAFAKFKMACELDPNNWEANYRAGVALIKLKKVNEAERYLSKAIKLNPKEIEIQKALGSIYIGFAKSAQSNGQTAKKLEYQLKACHTYPAATKVWLTLFEQWWENGDYKKIKEEGDFLYKNTTSILDEAEDVSLQQSLIYVARAYFNSDELAKAETFLNYAQKIRVPNDELYGLKRQIKNKEEEKVKAVIDKAEYHKNKKEYDKALGLLKDAKKLGGAKQSQIDGLIEEIERQVSLDKYTVTINNLIDSKQYNKALPKIEEALQTFPNDKFLKEKYKLVNEIIDEIEEKKDAEERAKKKAEDAKRQKELKIMAFKKAAKDYEKEGNFDGAIAEINKALKLDETNELTEYKTDLERKSKIAREKHRKFTNAQVDIRDFYKRKEYNTCIEKSESLLKDFPEHKETISVILADSYLKTENYEKAAKAVEPLASDTQNADLYNFSKGMYAYKSGNKEDAKKYLDLITEEKSPYYNQAKKTRWILMLTRKELVIFVGLSLIVFLIILLPKISEYMKSSGRSSMARKLEKIKETGAYEANYKFLEQRFEKEDVDNMKLVKLLYAAALQKRGNNAKAYQIICDYLKKDSRSPLAKNIAGETAMAIGETSPMALEQVQGLLKLNENRKDAVEYLAKAYIATKADHKLAQDFISKYITLNPNDSAAVTYLADIIISRLSYTTQSIKIFEKAIRANPDKADYYVAMMENYKSLGDTENAEKIQAVIAEKFPEYNSAPQQQQADNFYDPYSYPQDNAQPQDYSQQQNSAQPQDYFSQFQDYSNQQNNAQPQQDYFSQFQDYAQSQNYVDQANNEQNNQQSLIRDVNNDVNQNDSPRFYNPSDNPFGGTQQNNYSFLDNVQGLQGSQISQNNHQQNTPIIQGPKKNCPHCGAVNPANEYYCNTCGKPF